MRILGIEYGHSSVKAVEIESRFRKVEVLDLHEIPLPQQMLDPMAAYKDAIEQILSKLPVHPEKVVASVPSNLLAVRFLRTPVKNKKQAEQMVRYELEDSVPFRLNESIVEYQISRLKNESLIYAAIVPKKLLQAHIHWLNETGIDPDWLTFEGMGLVNLFLQSQADDKSEEAETPTLLIDIGHEITHLSFVSHGSLKYFLNLNWGGKNITEQVASTLNISLEEAESRKRQEFSLDEEIPNAVTEAGKEVLGAFIKDILHGRAAYRSLYQEKIGAIYLFGGSAKTPGLARHLSEQLEIPVRKLTRLSGMAFASDIDISRKIQFADALGQALVFTRQASILFNFRRGELAKGTSLTAVSETLKNPDILKLTKYLAVLVVMLFVYVIAATPAAKSDSQKRLEGVSKIFKATFRDVPGKLSKQLTHDKGSLKKFIDKRNKALAQKLSIAKGKKQSKLDLILKISNSIPKEVQVDVNVLTLETGRFTLEGVLYSGDLNQITQALKALSETSNITVSRNGKRFTYKGDIEGG